MVPSPWTSTMYWKYLGESTRLPNRTPFVFEGKPLDIWWSSCSGPVILFRRDRQRQRLPRARRQSRSAVPRAALVCEAARRPRRAFLAFRGDFLPYLGWIALGVVSIFTIVGWAWFLQFYLDWVCRNVAGPLRFRFVGRGVDLLWRSFVAMLGFGLIIPIPWVMAWLTRWFVSRSRSGAGRGVTACGALRRSARLRCDPAFP
ncbi:MAG: hypothetical protein U1E30_04720 [Rhodoblastus sp.]